MSADERRLLELLAESLNGATDALLTAQGFTLDVLVSLVHLGLVTAQPERTFAGGKPVERTRVRITDAGRVALAQDQESGGAGCDAVRERGRLIAPLAGGCCGVRLAAQVRGKVVSLARDLHARCRGRS